MPEWLVETMSLGSFSTQQLLVRLVVATGFGGCVALIYRASHGRHKEDSSTLTSTLVLLSILIAMVSMVIGDSIARAFSLVGALSIVRFRTIVDDTRDTAFVIFAVVVGMAAGAGLLLVPLVGIPIVGVTAIALSRPAKAPASARVGEARLSIRLALGRDPESTLGDILQRHLEEYRLVAVETARQGSALDLNYLGRLRSATDMAVLVSELNQVEGVQSVELRT